MSAAAASMVVAAMTAQPALAGPSMGEKACLCVPQAWLSEPLIAMDFPILVASLFFCTVVYD